MASAAELLQNLGIEDLATVLIGWDPRTRSVPAISAAIVVFVSGFLIGQILFNVSKQLPQPIRDYALEFVKTTTLCIYPFGLGILRKYYGETGFILSAVPVISTTLITFPNADGNLIVVWGKYFSQVITLKKCLLKTIAQIAAGLAAFRVGMLIMGLELHQVYMDRLKAHSNQVCGSALQVPLHVGLLAEMVGVAHVCLVSSLKFVKSPVIDTVIKVTNLALTLSAGSGLTGMFLNPANASCHTFGCGDTSRTAHVIVYWAGPLIGTWLSVQLRKMFATNGKETSTTPTSQPGGKRRKQD